MPYKCVPVTLGWGQEDTAYTRQYLHTENVVNAHSSWAMLRYLAILSVAFIFTLAHSNLGSEIIL